MSKLVYGDWKNVSVPLRPDGDGHTNGETNTTPVILPKANATLLILARNSDLDGIVKSILSIEERFNALYGYPYVFLNEEPFTDEFKA